MLSEHGGVEVSLEGGRKRARLGWILRGEVWTVRKMLGETFSHKVVRLEEKVVLLPSRALSGMNKCKYGNKFARRGGGGGYCMRLFCGSSANTKDEEMDKKCVLMVACFLS